MTERIAKIRRDHQDRRNYVTQCGGGLPELHRELSVCLDRIASLEALVRELESGCKAACGYLLNAKIDLETGAPKRTAIATIEGGLKTVRAALSHPLVSELTGEKGGGK